MKNTNFKLKTKVLNRAVSITALLLAAGLLFIGCPQKVKEEPKPVYYAVSLVHEGGSLTADPAIQDGKALKDSEITFTATPANAESHEVDKWEIAGGQILEGGNSGDTSVKVKITVDTTVKVTFKEKPKYTVTILPPSDGSLTAGSDISQPVYKDTIINFTASPANPSTHEVDKWEITGGTKISGGEDGSISVKVKITANTTVKVTFKEKSAYYTVSLVHEGGSLTANPEIQGGKALKDSVITFTASPANPVSHEVDKWEVTGGQVLEGGGEGSASVKVKITKDTTVKVTFKEKSAYYTVSLVHEGGSLTANPEIQGGKALKDSEITFTASPANASTHEVDKWEITGGTKISGGEDGSISVKVKITANTTVKVTFKPKPSFTSFDIPKAGISKAGTTLIAMIRGTNFKVPGIGPSNFIVNCADNPSITTGTTVTILSDSELTVSLTIPGEAGNYIVTITSGDQSLNGIFSVKDYSAYTVGKIVLKDGSLVAKDDYTSVDERNPPVAIIAGVNGYGAALGIALHISPSNLKWAKDGSTGDNTKFEGIICNPSDHQGSGAAYTATFTGDIDGSDNWDYICSIDPEGTANAAENYPAFHWVNRYNTTYAAQLGGTNIAWYMPSLAELCGVYRNRAAITESLAKIHGLGNSYADSSLGDSWFCSSSQHYYCRGCVWQVDFFLGLMNGYGKSVYSRVCCLAGF